ncbi:hypothetical protein ZIOFF_022551 [Zingiber officinale]|uniref:Protein kinase domain-containing protein n=1 Tax=Zingiber officinale TaxID=94328 RepID=A0A8J5LHA1_ZINOF|nr:hypothetical protein ZIOFF_022551 [Zingiber officinale]
MLLLCPLPLPVVSVHRDSALDWGLGSSLVISVGRPLPSPLETLCRAEGDQGNGKVAEPLALESVARRHTGALCAMKEVNIIPDDPKLAECLKQLEQEIKFLSQFKHSNIVQYYGMETCGRNLKHAEKKLSIEFGDP